MEAETTTGATASLEKEPSKSPKSSAESEQPKENAEATTSDSVEESVEKDVELKEDNSGTLKDEEGQKHGVKRKASEIDENSDEVEGKAEKKKKETEGEIEKQQQTEEEKSAGKAEVEASEKEAVRDETNEVKQAETSENKGWCLCALRLMMTGVSCEEVMYAAKQAQHSIVLLL